MKKIILLLLIASYCMAQPTQFPRIQGWQLLPSAKDSVIQWGSDSSSVPMAADTTALKLMARSEGDAAYLKQLASGNTNGGGWFVVIDSAYAEGIVAYGHPTAGKQWVRIGYPENNVLNIEWGGAITNDGVDDYSAIQSVINLGEVFHIKIGSSLADTFLVSQPIKLKSNMILEINGVVKVMDSDSVLLAEDVSAGASTFVVTNASNYFSVGQWVGVADTTQIWGYDTWRGWTGEIITIDVDTIELDNVAAYDYDVDSLAFCGQMNNAFLAENKTNITMTGHGVIDGNRDNQLQIHAVFGAGPGEQQKAGMGVTFYQCDYITIENLTFRNSIMHNISVTGSSLGDNYNIRIRNVNSVNGHDKNFMIRFCDYVFVENVQADSATWEDGLMFYGANRNVVVNGLQAKDNGRYGLGWNSSNATYFNASNIVTSGNQRGIAINAQSANISNVIMSDQLFLSNVYGLSEINFTNISFLDFVANDYAIYMPGNSKNISFTNIKFSNCKLIAAIKTSSIYGGSPEIPPQNIKFLNGGIYNHTGGFYSMDSGTEFEFLMFDPEYTVGFNPQNDSTKWLWRGDTLKTTQVDSVLKWKDVINGDSAIVDQDSLTKKPLNGTYYVEFDGDDFLNVFNTASNQNFTAGDFTLSGMLSIDTTYTNYIIAKYITAANFYQLYVAGRELRIHISQSGVDTLYAYTVGRAIELNTDFTFSVVVDRDSTVQFYINGGKAETTVEYLSTSAATLDTTFNIGSQRTWGSAGGTFRGKIYWLQYDTVAHTDQWCFDFYWYCWLWSETF